MSHDSALPDARRSHVSTVRTKHACIGLILCVLSMAAVVLMVRAIDLHGRWDEDGQSVIRFKAAGTVMIHPDCDGWPYHTRSEEPSVIVLPGLLIFPGHLASQRYHLIGSRVLVIDTAGPIPPGRYTYAGPNIVDREGRDVFVDIGLCGFG